MQRTYVALVDLRSYHCRAGSRSWRSDRAVPDRHFRQITSRTWEVRMSGQRNRRPAFTLVGLLVVIGIIALLIGILMPALGKARKASKTASCLSNVRQLVMAEIQYVNENKGRFSPYYNGGGGSKFQIEWMAQVAPKKTGQFDKVRLCPEASDENMPWHSDDNSKNQP